jgi:hypothetical protein
MTSESTSGITPGIQNGGTVVNISGVQITSDLGSQWSDTISGLLGLDYTNLGGNPISQYNAGLTQIHFEYFNSTTALGMNLSVAGSFGNSYFNVSNYRSFSAGLTSRMTGVDTIYIDTTGLFGLDRNNSTITGVIIHEFLHESKHVDQKASQITAGLKADFLANGGTLADWNAGESNVKAAVEHVVIGLMMEDFTSVNNLSSYRTFALGPAQYRAALEDALGVPRGALKGSGAVPAELRYVTLGEMVGGVGDMINAAFDRIGLVGDVIGGVRVHNDSGWIGALGTALFANEGSIKDTDGLFRDDRFVHQGFMDSLGDGAATLMHGIGSVVNGILGGVARTYTYVTDGGGGGAYAGQAANPASGVSSVTSTSGGVTRTYTYVAGGGGGGADSGRATTTQVNTYHSLDHYQSIGNGGTVTGLPVVLDLDGNGIRVADLTQSQQHITGADGLQHHTAWAGAGDGVLFIDADGSGTISDAREYMFTEWDPTANSDMEAIRAKFDTNGDGILSAADADFAKFKVLVTNADGTTSVKTLTELGITSIKLTTDATQIELPDGSVITGQTTFTRANGTTGTAADVWSRW